MGRTGHAFGALILVAVLSACDRADQVQLGGGVETLVDSSGAFPLVHNSGRAPRWSLELIGVVGSAAAVGEPAEDEFGQISSVTTGPNETVWVADQHSSRIKAFRPDGTLAVEFGREGEGPGEFRSIQSIAWVGDRLLVLDFRNGRISELSASGEWLGSRPAPGGVSGPVAMMRFYPLSDTTVLQWSVDQTGRMVWLEQHPRVVGDSWPQVSLASPQPTNLVCRAADRGTYYFPIPFSGRVLRHPAGEARSYVAWSAVYRYAVLGSGGDTLRVVEREWPTIHVTDEQWASETADITAFREEWPDASCEPRSISKPEVRAPLQNLLVDTEGRVWIEAVGTSGAVWEVFDTLGNLVATLPGFNYDHRVPPSIRGDRIAWVEADSLGVQYARWARVTERSSF